MTGRGFGPCGFGFGRRGFGFGRGMGRFFGGWGWSQSKESQLANLKDYKKALEEEIAAIQEEEKQLSEDK
jgi:hypothetical protein